MIKKSVNIEMLLTELPLETRIKKVAELGFQGFELLFPELSINIHAKEFGLGSITPRKLNPKTLKPIMKNYNIELVCFVVDAFSNLNISLLYPSGRKSYLKRLKKMVRFANELECKKLITQSGTTIPNYSLKKQQINIIKTLTAASKIAEKWGIILLLEPLNTLVDHPGTFVNTVEKATKIVRKVNSDNLAVLFDCYHEQIMSKNLISRIKENINVIKHFHAAGVPGRHEPYLGELNYTNIIQIINNLKYDGYFGLEYFPTLPSEKSVKTVLQKIQF